MTWKRLRERVPDNAETAWIGILCRDGTYRIVEIDDVFEINGGPHDGGTMVTSKRLRDRPREKEQPCKDA